MEAAEAFLTLPAAALINSCMLAPPRKKILSQFLPCSYFFSWTQGEVCGKKNLPVSTNAPVHVGPCVAFKILLKFLLVPPVCMTATSFSHALLKLKQFMCPSPWTGFTWLPCDLSFLRAQEKLWFYKLSGYLSLLGMGVTFSCSILHSKHK